MKTNQATKSPGLQITASGSKGVTGDTHPIVRAIRSFMCWLFGLLEHRPVMAARIGDAGAILMLVFSPSLADAASFALGDRVAANATVNVRSTPGGSSVGQHFSGDFGTIAAGPTNATYNGS